jgi:hypothetical protein
MPILERKKMGNLLKMLLFVCYSIFIWVVFSMGYERTVTFDYRIKTIYCMFFLLGTIGCFYYLLEGISNCNLKDRR